MNKTKIKKEHPILLAICLIAASLILLMVSTTAVSANAYCKGGCSLPPAGTGAGLSGPYSSSGDDGGGGTDYRNDE